MPSFVEIGSPVLEKKIYFHFFYHIWAWQPSCLCNLDYLYIHFGSPLPVDAYIKFDFYWPSGFRGEDL